jgi:hypothetical protein
MGRFGERRAGLFVRLASDRETLAVGDTALQVERGAEADRAEPTRGDLLGHRRRLPPRPNSFDITIPSRLSSRSPEPAQVYAVEFPGADNVNGREPIAGVMPGPVRNNATH